MNENEKKYKRSFGTLHLSEDFSERLMARLGDEGEKAQMNKKTVFKGFSRMAAAIAVACLVLGAGGICYAADVGGIRTKLDLWLNGEKNQVYVNADGQGFSWTDDDGQEHGFGGVSFDEDGNETPMSAEELAGVINNEASLRLKDDRIMLYYKNLSVDVTDMINNDGSLNVHIDDPANPVTYFAFTEITSKGAYSCSACDEPENGEEYIELDPTGLSTDGEKVQVPDDGISYSTSIITD